MGMDTTFFLLLMLPSVVAVAAVAEAAPPCSEQLMWFSPCLDYVSYPPNNLTDTASAKCCEAFFSSSSSSCLCYLLRDPRILGFPLNTTRLLSLSSLCLSPSSLDFLCAASPALPPLSSTGITSPHVTAAGSGTRPHESGGGPSGGRVPRTGRGEEGTEFFFPSSLNVSNSTSTSTLTRGYYKSLLLSQTLLAIIFPTLPLLNTL